jgi:hypothetical protein
MSKQCPIVMKLSGARTCIMLLQSHASTISCRAFLSWPARNISQVFGGASLCTRWCGKRGLSLRHKVTHLLPLCMQ